MGICHFNTSNISQLALPMIDVDVFGRIHKVSCSFAVFLCRFLQKFVFVSEADISLFAKLILAIFSNHGNVRFRLK